MFAGLWDDDVLWDLPARERRQVSRAMMLGRPLPPRLARAAAEHAHHLQTQSWYGWLTLAFGLLFGVLAALGAGGHVMAWWMPVGWALIGVCWLGVSAVWFRAVARAKRAVRDGRWPERY